MSSKYYTIQYLDILTFIYIQFYAFNVNKYEPSSHQSMCFIVTDNEMRNHCSESVYLIVKCSKYWEFFRLRHSVQSIVELIDVYKFVRMK